MPQTLLTSNNSLSRHPLAGFKQLLMISIPSIVTLFSGSLMTLCDRLFLAHDSLESLEACVNAANLCLIFQVLNFCTATAQVFVAQCLGAGQNERAGSYVWQMIWFSLFSIALTTPLSFVAESIFFRDTAIIDPATTYFRCLVSFNFLFPLGAALGAFYLGQGKMKVVMWAAFSANLLNIALDPLLIFGWGQWVPQLGILGAALATGIGQGFFCLILFMNFLSPKQKKLFGTGVYRIQWQIFWQTLKIGLPHCLRQAIVYCTWLAMVRLMTVKGGDYLLVFSITSSLANAFCFVIDGMVQGFVTITAYLIGKRDHEKIVQLIRTAFLFAIVVTILLLLPCIVFPQKILSFFLNEPLSLEQMRLLTNSCGWLWFFLLVYGANMISAALLVARGDTFFTMIYNLFSAVFLKYGFLVLALSVWQWSPDKFYLVVALGTLISTAVYFWRFFAIQSEPLIAKADQQS